MATGTQLIETERQRQRREWGDEHDDEHTGGELVEAAIAYAEGNGARWPWRDGWKPDTRVDDLVKAGALIAAEIDRLRRLYSPANHYYMASKKPACPTSCSDCGGEHHWYPVGEYTGGYNEAAYSCKHCPAWITMGQADALGVES